MLLRDQGAGATWWQGANAGGGSVRPGGKIGFYGATPVVQPSGADQVAVPLGNVDGEIAALTISDPPTQAEVQALRDKAEVLADVQAFRHRMVRVDANALEEALSNAYGSGRRCRHAASTSGSVQHRLRRRTRAGYADYRSLRPNGHNGCHVEPRPRAARGPNPAGYAKHAPLVQPRCPRPGLTSSIPAGTNRCRRLRPQGKCLRSDRARAA